MIPLKQKLPIPILYYFSDNVVLLQLFYFFSVKNSYAIWTSWLSFLHWKFILVSASFYTLPCISDFIIDVLVGCSQADIRTAALEQFFMLGQTALSSDSGQQTPHQFMLKVLLKAYLPFWVSSTHTRGASHR